MAASLCDVAFNFFGTRLASCSEDRHIVVLRLNDQEEWVESSQWEAHDSAILALSWAHPEFGTLLASSSSDCQVIIWEEVEEDMLNQITPTNPSSSRWIPRTVIGDLPFVALSVSFAPRFLGSLLVFSFFFSLFASLTRSFLC